jgi:signal transduction histidine kinase
MSEQFQQIWQQCSSLTADVQALSHELHPSILDNLGLVTAVRSFCREVSEQNGGVVEFAEKDIPSSLPREVSLSLFRVIQKALHNAVKYSGQKLFKVHLKGNADQIELEVSDRGAGFDVGSMKNGRGLGLVSMAERIHLLNGSITIDSKPNAGTTIRASVPLTVQTRVLAVSAS